MFLNSLKSGDELILLGLQQKVMWTGKNNCCQQKSKIKMTKQNSHYVIIPEEYEINEEIKLKYKDLA